MFFPASCLSLPPLGLLLFASLLLIYVHRNTRRRLPPGPRGLPLIGNILDLPSKDDPIPWAAHRETYGPISSVTVLGQTIVILNDLKTNNELLNGRSAKYAGRPYFPFASGLVGWDQQMIMAQPGDHFRIMRRLLKAYVGSPAAVSGFQGVLEMETRRLLLRIFREPERLIPQFRIAAGAMALRISHGYRVEILRPDPFVSIVENCAKEFFAATMPGAWLVDLCPWMKYLPKSFNFHKVAAEYRARNFEQSDRPFSFVKQELAAGTARPSFCSLVLNDSPDCQTEYAAKFAATAIYGGGSDPAVGALSAFVLAMVMHPECQTRARKELDAIVGRNRLPAYIDCPKLPYTEALMKETIRWQCTGRIGIPHRATEDDHYEGYLIPKDSLILPHMWHMTHDPEIYTSPADFRPERFLGEKPELDPSTYIFGFGRRACPGQDLAKAHMFTTIAMIIAVFDIGKERNEHGEEIDPVCDFLPGTVSHPREFRYRLEVRSDEARALIERVADDLDNDASQSDGDKL